jgi:ankyrin repeat protein
MQLYGASSTATMNQDLLSGIQRGNIEIVRQSLANGAQINVQFPADPRSKRLHAGGNTPLHEALKKVREKKDDARYKNIALLLINTPGVDASIRNEAHAEPLHILAGFVPSADPQFEQEDRIGIVKDNHEMSRRDLASIAEVFIDQLRPDVNARDEHGQTPLHWAALHGYPELVAVLIEHGAHVDAQDQDGRTPLMKAAQKGFLGIMQQLLNAGADVNLQDTNKGRTALHWVQRMREGAMIKHGNQMTKERALQAIKLLLDAGANPTLRDKEADRSVIDWARIKSPWHGQNQELDLLLSSSYVVRKAATSACYQTSSWWQQLSPELQHAYVELAEAQDKISRQLVNNLVEYLDGLEGEFDVISMQAERNLAARRFKAALGF